MIERDLGSNKESVEILAQEWSEAQSEVSPASTPSVRIAKKPLLVCFSHLRWGFVWQRPQHLLTRAAHYFDVIFVEEPFFEAVRAPHMGVFPQPQGVCVAVPHLPHGLDHDQQVAAQRDLIESLLASHKGRPTVFWFYTPMALGLADTLDRGIIVYDNMDELSAFRGASPTLLALEEDLLRKADLVFTGGVSLYEAKRDRHANIHAFPSSVDVAHFARARAIRENRAATPAPSASARLGFFGVLDERLDADLVEGIAALRPEWQIEMVGPIMKIEPETVPKRPNINWLGPCAYNDLPDRLAAWDIGIMPFAINEATRFISPTKTPEFLAAGLPVVSTGIVDVVRSYGRLGLVEVGATAADFVAAVERLLARPSQPWLDQVDRHLATSSWTATWDAMHTLIRDAMTTLVASEAALQGEALLWQDALELRTLRPDPSLAEGL